jgi:hypothetical protein
MKPLRYTIYRSTAGATRSHHIREAVELQPKLASAAETAATSRP